MEEVCKESIVWGWGRSIGEGEGKKGISGELEGGQGVGIGRQNQVPNILLARSSQWKENWMKRGIILTCAVKTRVEGKNGCS